MFKAYFETIKNQSVQFLNKYTYADQEARALLKNSPWKDLANILNYYLEHKLTNRSSEKNARWQKLRDELTLFLENNKNKPEKIMRLIHDLELQRTVGYSYKTPQAETNKTAGSFSDCFTILKNLKNSAVQSNTATNFWRLWLAKESGKLNKHGPRTLYGYGIKETIVDEVSFLEIPTRFYKRIAEKTYQQTENTMLVKENDSIRQQMHILESIHHYRYDILEIINELNFVLAVLADKKDDSKKYYLLNKELSAIILEKLLAAQQRLDLRKTTDQRMAANKLQESIDFIFNNIYRRRINTPDIHTVRNSLLTIIKRLQQRIDTIDKQYPRIVKKRMVLARELSQKAWDLFSKSTSTADDIALAAELIEAIASGYTNKDTLQESQFEFAEKLRKIENRLLILAALVEHKKPKFKEFDRLITEIKSRIIDLIKKLAK